VEVFLEMLKGFPIGDVGAIGLVVMVVVLIFKGEIIPRTTYENMLKSKDAENDMLKEAYRMSEAARATSAETDKELLELSKLTVHIVQSIQAKANGVST
jgi:hypothetical protein